MRVLFEFVELLYLQITSFTNSAWIFVQVPLWDYLQRHTADSTIATMILSLLETAVSWTGLAIDEVTVLSLCLSMFPFFIIFTMFRWFRH